MIIAFWFVVACLFSAPVLLMVVILRHRISRGVGRSLMAASFAASILYLQWRMDWFDIWRQGVPSLAYLVNYVLYAVAFAAAGWFLGGAVLRGSTSVRASR